MGTRPYGAAYVHMGQPAGEKLNGARGACDAYGMTSAPRQPTRRWAWGIAVGTTTCGRASKWDGSMRSAKAMAMHVHLRGA